MITIRKSNKGFTLIELLVVISIMAILGTIAVTTYIGTTLKA
ncbi:MAG: prepilin-type N-terminal cleavage/methylation domain-containing protein, partial [Nitrospiraceae bacterium]